MSEADWLSSCYLHKLIRFLPDDPEPSERKLRLFGVACCRRAAEWIEFPGLTALIDACERECESLRPFARRPSHGSVFERITGREAFSGRSEDGDDFVWAVDTLVTCSPSADYIADLCRDSLCGHDDFYAGHGEALFQADLFRDIFVNPFRPVAFDPTWRTSTAEAVAAGCYADRAFDRLPVLADALEDAGCNTADLLAHLRGPGPHVRGCWALDLVLGKS